MNEKELKKFDNKVLKDFNQERREEREEDALSKLPDIHPYAIWNPVAQLTWGPTMEAPEGCFEPTSEGAQKYLETISNSFCGD